MFCTKCGKKIEEGASFCTNCGQSVPEKENTKKEKIEKKEEKETKTTKNTKKEKVEKKETPKEEAKVEEKTINQATYTQPVTQPKEQISGTAIASLIMGIISFAICIIFSIIALPLSIAGFCLGIATKQKSGFKVGGIILNSISAIISVLVLIFFGTMIIMAIFNFFDNNHIEEPRIINNPVEGEWDCKSYNSHSIGDNYLFTLELDDDYEFTWYKTGERYSNYAKGTYTYDKLDRKSNDGNFDYYTVTLHGTEGVDNGTTPVKNYVTKYKMGVNDLDDEAIITDTETNLMYYCYR